MVRSTLKVVLICTSLMPEDIEHPLKCSYDFLNFFGIFGMDHYSYLILFIWVFSFHFLANTTKNLSILLIFSKNQLFVSLAFFVFFFISFNFINFALVLFMSPHLLFLSFSVYCFNKFLRYIFNLFICDFIFLMFFVYT